MLKPGQSGQTGTYGRPCHICCPVLNFYREKNCKLRLSLSKKQQLHSLYLYSCVLYSIQWNCIYLSHTQANIYKCIGTFILMLTGILYRLDLLHFEILQVAWALSVFTVMQIYFLQKYLYTQIYKQSLDFQTDKQHLR